MRRAFTMLELIFVIVVMGILGKYGADIFRNTYDAYLLSSVQNQLQGESELALQQVSNRLQYRLKDSVITRQPGGAPVSLSNHDGSTGYTVMEWVGYDIDGWQGVWDAGLGVNIPTWSGIIDLDANDVVLPLGDIDNTDLILTPGTDTGDINTVISALGGSTLNNAAIFFVGANTDIGRYGWNRLNSGSTAIVDQNGSTAHPIKADAGGNLAAFNSDTTDDFTDVDVYEQYKLAWSAYALRLIADGKTDPAGNNAGTFNLFLYSDYQPWEGETYLQGTPRLLLENVTHATWVAAGDIVRFQVCVANRKIVGDYSICKEKAIF